MNRKRIFALTFAVLMVLALAACGTKNNDKMGAMSGNGSAMTGEPKNAEEALALHKELLEQENAILSENTELWENVFMEAEKGMAMIEDGKNYGDFLLDIVEAAKEQFTNKEYEWLKESATEISNIENRLTELEEKERILHPFLQFGFREHRSRGVIRIAEVNHIKIGRAHV